MSFLISSPGASGGGGVTESYRADTHAGYGSTDTQIPYYTNVRKNTIDTLGAVVNNSTNGFKFTAAADCVVDISAYAFTTNASLYTIGVSLNSSQLTTGLPQINMENRLVCMNSVGVDGVGANTSVQVVMASGDVLRIHTDAQGVKDNKSAVSLVAKSV